MGGEPERKVRRADADGADFQNEAAEMGDMSHIPVPEHCIDYSTLKVRAEGLARWKGSAMHGCMEEASPNQLKSRQSQHLNSAKHRQQIFRLPADLATCP